MSIQMLAYWRVSFCSRMWPTWKTQNRGSLLLEMTICKRNAGWGCRERVTGQLFWHYLLRISCLDCLGAICYICYRIRTITALQIRIRSEVKFLTGIIQVVGWVGFIGCCIIQSFSWMVGWNVVMAWVCCGIGRSVGFTFGPRTEDWGGWIDGVFRAYKAELF